jgi:hypothetical protein
MSIAGLTHHIIFIMRWLKAAGDWGDSVLCDSRHETLPSILSSFLPEYKNSISPHIEFQQNVILLPLRLSHLTSHPWLFSHMLGGAHASSI